MDDNINNNNDITNENADGQAPADTSSPSKDDEFIIGKGFVVDSADTTENEDTSSHRRKRHRSKGIIRSIIWVFCIIVISVGIAFGIIYAGADYLGIGFGRGESCVVEIKSGTSTQAIAEQLKDAGAVRIPILFRLYSKLKHYDAQYKYGVYSFNNESGYEALAQMLMTEGATAKSVKVMIPEMSTVDDIAKLLEEANVCTKSDFINVVQTGKFNYDFIEEIPADSVYYRLEGYLFPDTYDFYNYDSEECAFLAVDKMLKTLDEKLTDDIKANISGSKYSFHELMTMASIVELEAGGSPDEMANVAAVFFNRLESDDFATLGSSPTIKYPYGNDRYNTYKCKGLPPGPLCSPSFSSIKAAITPTAGSEYYYFVTDASMKFYYNKTLAAHNAIIAKLKKENNWIYETID